MQVVSSERIDDSDLYNVTVNMVLKKGGSKKEEKETKPPQKSLELLSVVEQPDETVSAPAKFTEETIAAPLNEKIAAPVKLSEEPVKPAKKPIVIKPKKIVDKKQVKSPDSNSNFLAAATLFGTEQQAELDESEKYTSKLATAEYKKLEKSNKEHEENKPTQVQHVQTDEEKFSEKELEKAIALAEKNQDQESVLL